MKPSLFTFATAALLATGSTSAALNPGDLIITEFFANPSTGGPFGDDGEYFELYNTTNATINLNGLTFTEDDGDNEAFTIAVDAFIAPGEFFVIGGIPIGDGGEDTTLVGVLDLNYEDGSSATIASDPGFFAVGNGGDEIEIFDGATEIFSLVYSNGDPFGSDVSAELADIATALDGSVTEADYVASTTPLAEISGAFASPGTAGNFVPEPTSLALLGLGGLLVARRRRG